jgi:hypothetical protein
VRRHATNHENETAEIAETAESPTFFSVSSAPSAVIYKGIGHVHMPATKDENGFANG